MIADFSGEFINYEGTKDGDIIEFFEEGKVEWNEALKKDMYNLKVKHNGKVKTFSPNNKIGLLLQNTWGEDDKNWIGKKAQIVHIDKRLFLRPLQSEKA